MDTTCTLEAYRRSQADTPGQLTQLHAVQVFLSQGPGFLLLSHAPNVKSHFHELCIPSA